jgi:hypothetical protein
MKFSNLYVTQKEITLRKELRKKYKVQEHMLTGHAPERLYPPRLNRMEIAPKKTSKSS